jgi:hypothetical protein
MEAEAIEAADTPRSSVLPILHAAQVATQATQALTGTSRSSALPSTQKPALVATPEIHKTKETRLPEDYRPDVLIHINPCGEKYRAYIDVRSQTIRASINMTHHDLAALNKDFQREMEAIAKRGKTTREEWKIQFRPLAEIGKRTFRRVFGDSSNFNRILTSLHQDPTRPCSIAIISEEFFLPWELIYPTEPSEDPFEPIYCDHFWGMRYIIHRTVPNSTFHDSTTIPHRPKLGLLTDKGLPSVEEKEIPFFNKLQKDGKICLLLLPDLDPEKEKLEELRKLKTFWRQTLHLAHFACHAYCEGERPHTPIIQVSVYFPISLGEMEEYGIGIGRSINGSPLIIMNGCKTGKTNPLYTSSDFASMFLGRGALGVVATECEVPDNFAADFAEQLYNRLLNSRMPLGKSLWDTRKHFWNQEYPNPSGLLYSMYGPPSIQVGSL